jgi:hypothetical protein
MRNQYRKKGWVNLPHKSFFQYTQLLVTPVRRRTGNKPILGRLGAADHIPGRAPGPRRVAGYAVAWREVQSGGAAGPTHSAGSHDHTGACNAAADCANIAAGLEGEHVVVVQGRSGEPLLEPHARISRHQGRKLRI